MRSSSATQTPTIVSSRTFRDNQRKMKSIADRDVVHITENGASAYVFCSEEVFRREAERLADEIAYEREFEREVALGMADAKAGRVFEGTAEEIMAEIARRAETDD